MMDYYIRLPDGSLRRTDAETWARQCTGQSRRIAKNECCGYLVSTVFLGLDHNMTGTGQPVLFETMVFVDGDLDHYQERYCTENEALAGHKRILDAIARGDKEL